MKHILLKLIMIIIINIINKCTICNNVFTFAQLVVDNLHVMIIKEIDMNSRIIFLYF